MMAAVIERRGQVAVLRLTSEQNRWGTGFVADVTTALDEVATDLALVALVTTGPRPGGLDAASHGIAVSAHAEDELIDTAVALATRRAGTDPAMVATLESDRYADAPVALEPPEVAR